jgi:ferritin-like metal-binding protein YciE
MAMDTLHDVLVDQLRDLYGAEKQLTRALPRMAKAANDPQLRNVIQEHIETTNSQIQRLEQVFEHLDMSAKAKHCAAMEGIIEEGKEIIDKKGKGNPAALDAALIAAAQKVEHYEICGYGSARTFAQVLGLEEAARLLQQTLDEENDADKKLNSIAEQVNSAALEREEEEEEEDESVDEEEELEDDIESQTEGSETIDDSETRGGGGMGGRGGRGGSGGGSSGGRGGSSRKGGGKR